MSKLFIDTIIQYGGKLTEAQKLPILDLVAKYINKKMKILEYKYAIQLKIPKLPEKNSDCIQRKIMIPTVTQINSNIHGQLPFYTTAQIALPTPTISTVISGVPLTPYGPIVGVPSLAINPFGSSTNSLDDRIKKAEETLKILIKIDTELKKAHPCKFDDSMKISESDKLELKKYFDYVDLIEPNLNEITEKIASMTEK